MSVWFCIPSARPPVEIEPVLAAWKERGYKIALWRDNLERITLRNGDGTYSLVDYIRAEQKYPGYAQAVNALVADVLKQDPACDFIVTGGDDTFPDGSRTAEEIAYQCGRHFAEVNHQLGTDSYRMEDVLDNEGIFRPNFARMPWSTFGVMQPTGDRFAHGSIDRIAGSPWLGREWCLRANQGKGPFWPEFTHMFVDECLKRTAEKLGVYWPRPDLMHFHDHFMRETNAIDSKAVQRPMPDHLKQWNTQQHWDEMQAIFQRLEREDFKSCLPL